MRWPLANRRLIAWANRRPVLGSLAFAVWWTAGMNVLVLVLPHYNWKLALALSGLALPLVFVGMHVVIREGWLR